MINTYPVPEAYGTIIESREGYHSKWDQPKDPTIKKFKEHYPQYSKYEHPEGKSFGWFWYFAMQQLGDDAAAANAKAMKEKLQQRSAFSRISGYFFPSIHTQLSLNELCQSDMTNYLNFMNSLEKGHEAKRLYFYPKVFENQPIDSENWEQHQLEYFRDDRRVNWWSLLPLLIGNCLLLIGAGRNW